jgi:hypothetical protein
MDIYDIKTYFKYDNQKKAIIQAMRHGISKKQFLEMKKNAGFTNWTKEKRKYKKQLQDENENNNIIMVQEIDNTDNTDITYNIWSNINIETTL